MKHQSIACFTNAVLVLAGLSVCFTASPLNAQQAGLKRHPGDHLHYNVTLADGDVGKVANVTVSLKTSATARPDQQGINQFGGRCQKTSDPKIWTCDVVIRPDAIDGDYQLFQVGASSPEFGKDYSEDFHVPVVPIENPNTFHPPSHVTVTAPH
jgi:hypothetical protein